MAQKKRGLSNSFPTNVFPPWQFGEKTVSFDAPVIMGVLNVTPDSFSDGGKFADAPVALHHARQMIAEGATIIDIGGESSRPGAMPVHAAEELARVLPIVAELAKSKAIISVDTAKPEVAEACLAHGAHIVNDITGFTNSRMVAVAKKFDAGVVVMHMQGSPQTMQQNPTYGDVVKEVKAFLIEQVAMLQNCGIEKIAIDPGIGFGKSLEHNMSLLANIHKFTGLGVPVCIGASRKSFIGKITGAAVVEDRLSGTIATNVLAFAGGARIFRVHDVAENKKALDVAHKILVVSK